MRKQTRPPTPEVLVKHGERWSRQWVDLREKNPSASFQWYVADGISAREWLLPVLKEMNQDHCAFCDKFRFDDCSPEPIEHFKPKSDERFHAAAYAWDNLYYCCDLCQNAKREQWDDRLLRPDESNYVFERFFQFDFTTGELKPNRSAGIEDRERAMITIQLYGLDLPTRRRRRLELRKWQQSTDRELNNWAFRDFLERGEAAQ